MPNSTHEGSSHERHNATPGRGLSHAFIALLPVLACFLGGGTQKWGEGIVVVLLGLYLLANPPGFSLGLALNLVLLALFDSAVVAVLPARLFLYSSCLAFYFFFLSIYLPNS